MNKSIYKTLIELNRDLYHITEFENLESILKTGLLSLKNIVDNKIPAKFISSDSSRSIDEYYGLDEYVRLAYTIQYDMICLDVHNNALKNPVILVINPNILLDKEDIVYTTMNALKRESLLYNKDDKFTIDFQKIYEMRSFENAKIQEYKDARQSEILVKNKVELNYIKHIFVENDINLENLSTEIPIYKGEVKKTIKKIV
ncbi:DarT ssDNA thymidine ADP-ribosyltransferase family protein [Cetobacterium sp.]|uniref:DarT ssDNA thymidine ADP-ribosyltransferase family protein n=1 Tax=Cetobacterium sp. TaxID=2071632 RepID=UPI002FCACD87